MRRSSSRRSKSFESGLARAALSLSLLGSLSVRAETPEEVAASDPSTHAVGDGDTLWDLSNRYLGSPYDWPRLWSYNPEITNPHWIYPGYVLRLREGAQGGFMGEPGSPAGAVAGGKGASLLMRRGAGLAAQRNTVIIGEQVYLDEDALGEAARIVGAPSDHMMFSPSDEVYLQYKKDGDPLVEGKEVLVFRRLKREELSPVAKNRSNRIYPAGSGGEIVRVLGSLKVRHVDTDKRIARAEVIEAIDPIERGFEVADVPRTLADVPPKVASRKVDAKIVASTRPLGVLGHNQLAFVSAGQNQGVEVGNRFLVVRQGDSWRRELTVKERLSGEDRPEAHPLADDQYPWEVVGELRVIYVRPETSTALVTDSRLELSIGDRVELREGY